MRKNCYITIMNIEKQQLIEYLAGKKPGVQYYGVFLNTDTTNKLIDSFGTVIPSDWKVYAHHMTMLFGKNKSTFDMKSYCTDRLGDEVKLYATHIGVSDKAVALQITADVPVTNTRPHITIATSPNGKPVESNDITDWRELPKTIEIPGVIDIAMNDGSLASHTI
jgi:hypothetical protein